MSSFRVETTNDVASVALDNTYRTKWQDVFDIEYPDFEFDYPSNWQVENEICKDNEEFVTLTNERGVEIKFSHSGSYAIDFHADLSNVHLVKVYESLFTPGSVREIDYSYLGEFVVAKIIGEDGSVMYGVVPASYIGTDGVMSGGNPCAYSF